MMKKFLCTLLPCLLLLSCTTVKTEKDMMKGVKTMTVTQVQASMRFGVLALGDTVEVTVSHYDEDGRILRSERYDKEGVVETVNYHWQGNHYESTQTLYDYGRNRTYKHYVHYDDDGRIDDMRDLEGDEDTIISEVAYEYDDRGNIAKEVETYVLDNKAHTWIALYSYSYDDKGRIQSFQRLASTYDEDGIYQRDVMYTYKRDGSYITEENPSDEQRIVNKYDTRGNLLESYTYNAGSPDYKDVYEYNKKGRKTKWTIYVDDIPHGIHLYEYEMY